MSQGKEQVLVIMQGPSGSGKTTFAERISSSLQALVYSTDDYHETESGYLFQPKRLTEFHLANQKRVHEALVKGYSVIVDNTNIHAWEARPYVESAVELGVPVVFVRCEGRYPNNHGVPPQVVEVMWRELEELSVEKCLKAIRPQR